MRDNTKRTYNTRVAEEPDGPDTLRKMPGMCWLRRRQTCCTTRCHPEWQNELTEERCKTTDMFEIGSIELTWTCSPFSQRFPVLILFWVMNVRGSLCSCVVGIPYHEVGHPSGGPGWRPHCACGLQHDSSPVRPWVCECVCLRFWGGTIISILIIHESGQGHFDRQVTNNGKILKA